MEVTGISIVAVPVDDIDEALNFFCGVLGMEKRKDLSGSEGRYIEVAQGVRFEREPLDLPGGTYAALRDPWDNLFVLADNRK